MVALRTRKAALNEAAMAELRDLRLMPLDMPKQNNALKYKKGLEEATGASVTQLKELKRLMYGEGTDEQKDIISKMRQYIQENSPDVKKWNRAYAGRKIRNWTAGLVAAGAVLGAAAYGSVLLTTPPAPSAIVSTVQAGQARYSAVAITNMETAGGYQYAVLGAGATSQINFNSTWSMEFSGTKTNSGVDNINVTVIQKGQTVQTDNYPGNLTTSNFKGHVEVNANPNQNWGGHVNVSGTVYFGGKTYNVNFVDPEPINPASNPVIITPWGVA